MRILSIPTAEASTPQPTYGILASSRRPCSVPSSPKCRATRKKSRRPHGLGCPLAQHPQESLVFGVWREKEPIVSQRSRAREKEAGSAAIWYHAPLCVISTGIGSNLDRSIASKTDRADRRDTSCSAERPPKMRRFSGEGSAWDLRVRLRLRREYHMNAPSSSDLPILFEAILSRALPTMRVSSGRSLLRPLAQHQIQVAVIRGKT